MGDNGEVKVKTCRFSGEPCIGEACEQWVEMGVAKPGMITPQKQGMCVFKALVIVGMSPKVMAPPQQINIPKL
ncbi:unnamed protein product [marine sediment metagenome]|uniref:Uncharacterized protein n=1 Tax=marine sediment metagenome TaxID=412755 RepID=X1G564_9ZZZZ